MSEATPRADMLTRLPRLAFGDGRLCLPKPNSGLFFLSSDQTLLERVDDDFTALIAGNVWQQKDSVGHAKRHPFLEVLVNFGDVEVDGFSCDNANPDLIDPERAF